MWFYADEWELPELFFDTFHFRIDPTWHEFESVEYSEEVANAEINLDELIIAIRETKGIY
jgi:hypothetical protein